MAPIIPDVFKPAYVATITSNIFVNGALWGVGIAVIALILLTIREMWQKSKKDFFFYSIFTLTLLTLVCLELPPVKTILIFSFIGIFYKHLTTPKEER